MQGIIVKTCLSLYQDGRVGYPEDAPTMPEALPCETTQIENNLIEMQFAIDTLIYSVDHYNTNILQYDVEKCQTKGIPARCIQQTMIFRTFFLDKSNETDCKHRSI